ncbi:hypothetical protein VCHA53O466_40448 [Vibrio chagasii]|nr:hypothetical protein VCHA53O466_40448 [Vibrio chagasii]
MLKEQYRLFMCAPESGEEGMIDFGSKDIMYGRLATCASEGKDVWLITPSGNKILPSEIPQSISKIIFISFNNETDKLIESSELEVSTFNGKLSDLSKDQALKLFNLLSDHDDCGNIRICLDSNKTEVFHCCLTHEAMDWVERSLSS